MPVHRQLLSLSSLFFLLAIVLFALAGLGVPEAPRGRYLGWGLFCLCISEALPI